MNVTENKPYLPLAAALVFLTLPLAVLLQTLFDPLFRRQPQTLSAASFADPVLWTVFGVFWVLNAAVSAGLVKVAYRKMMRRRFHYALFLTGIAACIGGAIGMLFEAVFGVGVLGGLRAQGLVYYSASVFALSRCFLPKTLTRAPVQQITFYPKKK